MSHLGEFFLAYADLHDFFFYGKQGGSDLEEDKYEVWDMVIRGSKFWPSKTFLT